MICDIHGKIFSIVALLLLSSCAQRTNESFEEKEETTTKAIRVAEKTIAATTTLRDSLSEEMLEENLFGKFFNDRAEFFIVKNPKMKVYGSDVEAMTLYYIDGVLCKTKYKLKVNVAPQLINAFGKFKILGRDSLNTAVLKNEKVLVGKNTKHINANLTNYEMTWLRDDKFFVLDVNETYGSNYFELSEKLLDYDSRLRSVDIIFG